MSYEDRFKDDWNPKGKGNVSVAAIKFELLKAGKIVLSPEGDNERYDVVVDEDKRFITIQCKTARLLDGKLVASAHSNTRKGRKHRKDYKGEVDLFGIYSPDFEKVYFISVKQAPTTDITLRIHPTKSGRKKNIVWAEKYKYTGQNLKDFLS